MLTQEIFTIFNKALERTGSMTNLAAALRCSRMAVYKWRQGAAIKKEFQLALKEVAENGFLKPEDEKETSTECKDCEFRYSIDAGLGKHWRCQKLRVDIVWSPTLKKYVPITGTCFKKQKLLMKKPKQKETKKS